MTYIEFAEKVLGIELLDYQKTLLEEAQKCKDECKSFYILPSARTGKILLGNVIQQKLGYDRGFEDGSMLVIRNVLDSLKEIQRGFGTLEEFIDQLEESVKKEEKDKTTIIIDEWMQSPSQTLKKESDKFVELLEKTSSIRLPEKEEDNEDID